MVEWKYEPDEGCVVEVNPDVARGQEQLICSDVRPEDAALIVEAPTMKAILTNWVEGIGLGNREFEEARAILRRIDRKGD